MRVHKDKFKKAVEMLNAGKSPRQVAKSAKLSLNQVLEIADIIGVYIDLDELKEKKEKEEVLCTGGAR